jgi:imidazoleglycerol-phosphate dehydratase
MTVIRRATRETDLEAKLTRGSGQATVETGDQFLDHMLATLARYSGLDLELRGRGDLRHHLIEDAAIVVGQAVRALATPTIGRFAARTIPMDDALVEVALDLGDRPYYRGPLPSKLYDHWMRSFADNARATLHVRVLRGQDRHHIIEAGFKALGLALHDALADSGAVLSTKGAVTIEAPGGTRPGASSPSTGRRSV